MDPENSGGMRPAQTGPQQPQLLADAVKSPSKSDPLKTFHKGEPFALGITQILIGILLMAFGIINFLRSYFAPPYLLMRTPCWTGALVILYFWLYRKQFQRRSLSVAAAKNPEIALVKGMLGMNVVSAVVAALGVLFFAFAVGEFLPYASTWDPGCSHLDPETYKICYEVNVIAWNMESGMMMILLVFTIVELGLAITTAAFGCATLCRDTYNEKVIVVYQHRPQDKKVSSPPAGVDVEPV